MGQELGEQLPGKDPLQGHHEQPPAHLHGCLHEVDEGQDQSEPEWNLQG